MRFSLYFIALLIIGMRQREYTRDVLPLIPVNEGFDAVEEDARESVGGYIKRFKKWHGVKDRTDL